MKRRRHFIMLEVTTKPDVSTRRAIKDVRDGLKSHVDTFYYEDTGLRVRAVSRADRGIFKLLSEAAEKFRFYQSQHEQKYRDIEAEIAKLDEGDNHAPLRKRLADTHEKARVNADIASRIERFLDGE